jgi:hypothetical protein
MYGFDITVTWASHSYLDPCISYRPDNHRAIPLTFTLPPHSTSLPTKSIMSSPGELSYASRPISLINIARPVYLHTAQPSGSEQEIHSLQTYVTTGEANRAIIVIIPDMFGWQLPNTRLLADRIQRETGATVYVPDFMAGELLLFLLLSVRSQR